MFDIQFKNEAAMLVKFFNMRMNTRFKGSSQAGFAMDEFLRQGESTRSVMEAMKEFWADEKVLANEKDDIYCFQTWYRSKLEREEKEKLPADQRTEVIEVEAKEEEKEEKPMASNFADAMNIVTGVVAQMVSGMKSSEIKETVCKDLKADIDKYIADTYGKIEKQVTLVSEFGKHEVKGVQHKMFDVALAFVANNEPVYLAGPAGSGKNVLCKQIADALGLDFYFTNAVTQEYKLTGFTDANGTYHESQFYKAFKNGGVFMLDEMDASIPEVLIILNAAIANRYFDFPAPIGKVEAHENFRVIAAGNTLGHGADEMYVGRNTLDAASLDRFAMLNIDYDVRIEMAVANNDSVLVDFCRSFRKAAQKAGLSVVVSYRAIGRLAKMKSLMDAKTLLKSCLVKGLELDDLNILINEIGTQNEYVDALREIAKDMKE